MPRKPAKQVARPFCPLINGACVGKSCAFWGLGQCLIRRSLMASLLAGSYDLVKAGVQREREE